MQFTNRNDYYRKPRRKKKTSRVKSYLYRFIIIGFILWFLYLFLGGQYGLVKITTLYTKIKQTDGKIDRLIAEQVVLTKKCERLKGDLFTVEQIAREKLGMLKDGEVVYRIKKKD